MRFFLPIVLLFSFCFNLGRAETPAEKGYAIAREYDRRDLGYKDYVADMEMVLINANGEKSTRQLRAKTIEVEQNGESERRLLVLEGPRDVRGTVLLIASQKQHSDDQWLYFPSIKRVKRISSGNKSGPFMGSEFAYEDFSSPELDKYTYSYLGEGACGEQGELVCYMLERYPVEKDSGYSKQVLWIDRDEYRLWQVHFYDRKNSLLKTLRVSEFLQYLDKYWRAGRMHMENVQTNKKTMLVWSDYKFSTGLDLTEFHPSRLQNVR